MKGRERGGVYEGALKIALEKLRGVDIRARCSILGLPGPGQDGTIAIRVFGRDMELALPEYRAVDAATGEIIDAATRILVLHYLCAEFSPAPTGEILSFRSFPSGMFYWGPFRERSAALLERAFHNDIELLKNRLARFDWEPYPVGDFGASVHALGTLRLYLVYRLGDREFPPSAEILFDSSIRRVYSAEDAAVLAQKLSLGLVKE